MRNVIEHPDHATPQTVPTGPTSEELRQGNLRTQVRPAVAWGMIGVFLAILFGIPIYQAIAEWRGGQRPGVLGVFGIGRFPRHGDLQQYEANLSEQSRAVRWFQPRMQEMIAGMGGLGSTNVVVGRERFLFYRPGIDSITGPGFLDPESMPRRTRDLKSLERSETIYPDPRPAILQFKRQLEAAGARLILLPVPDKASLQGAELSARVREGKPARNRSFDQFIREMRAAGVEVLDPSPRVVKPGEIRYLAQDTHWTPQWMDEVARALAELVRGDLGEAPGRPLSAEAVFVSNTGDLAEMLQLGEGQTLFGREGATISRVVEESGARVRADAASPVLLLGDSFTNIYSAKAMGWGEGAGLAERVSYYLRRPIDWMARNDAGAYATREMLAHELAQGRDRLGGKKVVIWEFAARELSLGNWKPIDLVMRPRENATADHVPPAGKFLVPVGDQVWAITGRIEAKGASPRPGRVAYRDHIIGIHLVDVRIEEPAEARLAGAEMGQAVVYLRSMTDMKLTPAAGLQVGQVVRVKVQDWSGVSRRYELINRSDPPDAELRIQPACWGELEGKR